MPPMVGAPWWAASDRSKLFEKGRTTLAAAKRESLKRLPSAPQPPVESAPAEEDFPEDSEVEPPKSLPTLDRQRSSWVKALTLLKRKMGTEKQQPVKTSPTSLPSTMTKRRASFLGSSMVASFTRKSSARIVPDFDGEPASSSRDPLPLVTVEDAISRLSADCQHDDWLTRNEAISALPTILAALPPAALRSALDSLGEPLSQQLADLRSAIVRSACECVIELATQHRGTLASSTLVPTVLPRLLSNLALLKVFASASISAASVLVGLAPSTATLKVLIIHTKASQKQVRAGSFELLAILLNSGKAEVSTAAAAAAPPPFRLPPKGLSAALAALGRGVSDPDGATRSAAARAYWAAIDAAYDQQALERWLATLGAMERKLVQRYDAQK